MAEITETLKKLGLAAARGVPQLATGFVDLAALPFTMTGMLKPEQAVGSTAYLTSKGLLPPEQKGLLNETTELVSSALNPAGATKAALAKGGLLMAAPIAYHGSPHVFEKFDLSKVGSGEGSQAYGYGMYFAESPDVAKTYAPHQMVEFDGKKVKLANLQTGDVVFEDNSRRILNNEATKKLAEKMKNAPVAGGFYKVDIPDSAVATFLDWDKPISEQGKNVQQTVKKISDKYGLDYDNTFRGSDFYRALTVDLNAMGLSKNYKDAQEAASEMLKSEGVGGVKYFDAASRGGKQGTRNFVVFDPSIVKMLERNDKPMQGLLGK